MSQTISFSRTLARALARHANHSFGLMGNGNAHLIDALAAENIRYTAVRHEAGTVAAADAYTRVSGQMAIATTTYGAGFTNTITALAESAQARIPMLVVVGDAPSTGPRPWDVDQEMMAAAMGIRTHILSVTNIDRTVDRAAQWAQQVRRPVVIAIPYDLAAAEITDPGGINLQDPAVIASLSAAVAENNSTQSYTPLPHFPSDTQLDAAAELLRQAARPVILAGRGAHLAGASAELGELARKTGALTATTALARGIFPEAQYDLGITGGFGQEAAMAQIAGADVVVVVGAGLNQFTMRFGDLFGAGATVLRIDSEQVSPPRSNNPITHTLLQGDARAIVAALVTRLPEPQEAGWRKTVAGLEPGGALRVRNDGLAQHPDGICADGRLDPRSLAARLNELLPADRYVTSDGGHFIGWANTRWDVASPERMVMVGTAYQTIGLGFPTVAGIAAAAPGKSIVLTTGDGGGLMALADFETAVREAASLVVVVWNDGAYGAEVHLYGAMGLAEEPMLIPSVNFAAIGEALGAKGVRVESLSDLDALREWVDAGAKGTIVLDCQVSRSVVAEYQREIQRVNGVVVADAETDEVAAQDPNSAAPTEEQP